MPVTYKKTVAVLQGPCSHDDAEPLLSWLLEEPGRRVNLKQCEHLHGAVLQVLVALRPAVSVPPDDPFLARWLMPSLELPLTAAQAAA